jgi:hypothetical protein
MKTFHLASNFGAFLFLLLFISCGSGESKNGITNQCMTLEAKRLQCRTIELSKYPYNTEYYSQYVKAQCERLYQVARCYSTDD